MIHEEEVKHFLTMAERAMRWKDSDPLRAMGALEKTAEVIRDALEDTLLPLKRANLAPFNWYIDVIAEAELDKSWWNPEPTEWLPQDHTIASIKRAVRCTCSRMWLPHAPTDAVVEGTRELYYCDGIAQGDDATAEQLLQWVRLCPVSPLDIYLVHLTEVMQDEWMHLVDYAREEGQIDRKQRKRLREINLSQYCYSDEIPTLSMADILAAPPTGQKQQPQVGAAETFVSRYDGKQLVIVFNRLTEKGYLTCSENTWLYLWGVFVHPVKRKTIERPAEKAEWSAARGKKQALMEMIRTVMANDCSEILKKTAQWFVFSDKTIPDPKIIKSYKIKGEKSRKEFLQLVTVH